jgi:hypothetical protein
MPIIPETADPDLVAKRFIDQSTGKSHTVYYYKRKLVPQVRLNGTLSEQVAGYALIEKDLQNALRWYKKLTELVEPFRSKRGEKYTVGTNRDVFDVAKGLFVAALTFYGKCFTQCEGRRAQLNRSMLASELRGTHDNYMLYRNSFAAHSGREKLEHAAASLLLHPKKKKQLVPRLVVNRYQPDFILSTDGEPGLSELIVNAISVANDRHDRVTRRLMETEVMPKGLDHWYRQAKK